MVDITRVEELVADLESLPPGDTCRSSSRKLRDFEPGCRRIAPTAALLRQWRRFVGLDALLGRRNAAELGEWSVAAGRDDESHSPLREAREIFERLHARRWIDRLDRVASGSGRHRHRRC